MSSICQAPAGGGLVSGILDFVDCQAQAIGMGGHQALAAPGSGFAIALNILLVLFIALFGYRLLLGERLQLRDGVLAAIKVGIVFTLAFSWPAYQTLVYDVVFRAPAEIAAAIGRPAGIPGSDGGLVARLDGADRSFVALNALGIGAGLPAPVSTWQAGAPPRQPPSTFEPFALGGARVFYLLGALGGFAVVRLTAGLLLAIGPLFVAFLLFDSTRGLFAGWLRVLAGAALAAVGAALVLGVQLALLEPRLAELLTWRSAGYAIPGAAVELFAVSLAFALATLAALMASWRVTSGFGFPGPRSHAAPDSRRRSDDRQQEPWPRRAVSDEAGARSRAAAVADSVITMQRREVLGGFDPGAPRRQSQPHASRTDDAMTWPVQPLGQAGRRTQARISAGAQRRDTA
ncbi:MAG: type IV secretion system protein [Thermaurantiacus sp.]